MSCAARQMLSAASSKVTARIANCTDSQVGRQPSKGPPIERELPSTRRGGESYVQVVEPDVVLEELRAGRVVRRLFRRSAEKRTRRHVAQRLQAPGDALAAILCPERQSTNVRMGPAHEAREPSARNRIRLSGKDERADLLRRQVPSDRQMNEKLAIPRRQGNRTPLLLLHHRR